MIPSFNDLRDFEILDHHIGHPLSLLIYVSFHMLKLCLTFLSITINLRLLSREYLNYQNLEILWVGNMPLDIFVKRNEAAILSG